MKFPTTRKIVPIHEVFPNKWNCNVQDEAMFKKEVASIKKHGFIDPILVREVDNVYEIIDGEHRWKALNFLDYKEIIVESLGEIDDSTAKVLTITMNNLRGQDDVLKRAEILKQLNEGQLALLPFDKKQLENEIKLLDFDFSQFEKAEIEEEEKLEIPIKKLKEIQIVLEKIKAKSRSQELRLLIHRYFDIVKAFELIMKKKI